MSFSASVIDLVEASNAPLAQCAEHWIRVPLAEIASVVNGFPWKSEFFNPREGIPVVRIRDVTTGATQTRYSGPITDGYLLQDRDLLVGMDGDFNVCLWRGGPALLNQRVCKIIPDERFLLKDLLVKILPGYLDLINAETHSVTVKHLSSKTLLEVPVPLPPVPEQRRVVAKIDRLSARSKRAREDLAQIAKLVTRLKEAALESAFNCDLQGESRELVSIQHYLGEKIRNGLSVAGSDVPPGVRALKLSALKTDTVDLSDVRYLDIDAQRAASFALEFGDLLVSRGNGSLRLVGRAAVVPEGCENTIFPDTAFRLRPKKSLSDARWLCLMWNAPQMRRQIEAAARTTAGIWKISQADISTFEIPDVRLHEQREIVRRIEHAFAAIDRLAAEAASAQKLLDRLDQAVLAKAFRGELVSQDPNDEPASVLLERIRAERAATPAPKRGRRPKAAP